ncbi:MAG: TIGR00282 family metallophosphoesterase [Pirellulales bacterium]
MRLLMIGDVVGRPGRRVIVHHLEQIRREQRLDCVIANAENAAEGSGITPQIFFDLVGAGVDCITLGDHIYRRKEIYPILEEDIRVVKPANFPGACPGRPWTVVTAGNGVAVGVISLLGRVFMRPADCPFTAADRMLHELPAAVRVRIVDMHAEATSDKQLLGRYLDGRVTAVLGTHTHVTTADEQLLPGGTAFQCDVGMTGPHHSILGRRIDRVWETTLTFRPTEFEVAKGDVQLHGTIVTIDPELGRATAIERFVFREPG